MIDKIINQLSNLTVLEIVELINKLEKKWNIKNVNHLQGGADNLKNKDEIVNKTHYDLHLKSVGDKRIKIISIVRDIIGSGLKDAKNKIDSVPNIIKSSILKKDAEKLKIMLEKEGAQVELK